MILDKTGTLTEGRLAVVRWHGSETVRRLVAAAEAHSTHPGAIALAAGVDTTDVTAPTDVEQHPGRGLTARIDGRDLLVGAPAFAEERVGRFPDPVTQEIRAAIDEGFTPIVVALGGEIEAVAALGDPVRSDTADALAAIKERGWQVEVLSGDHPGTVGALMHRLRLDPATGRGGAVPEDKVERVRQTAELGTVVMVGDGVNDAAALAAATVGIGVHGGAEAVLAAADVYLGEPGLAPLVRLLDGSRRTLGVIRRNLVFSLAYNAVAVTLAMLGFMHPLVAAILMPASSITVVVNSYRARTFE
jgi:Cu2+-exporting ATPase